MSEEGFSEIAAIAKLALLSLETPDGHVGTENIARALSAIAGKADMILELISNSAESAGYPLFDRRMKNRLAAHAVYRQEYKKIEEISSTL